jgi:hypothetical protein
MDPHSPRPLLGGSSRTPLEVFCQYRLIIFADVIGKQQCTTLGNKSAQEMATRMHNCGVNKTVFSKFQKSASGFLAGSFFPIGL